MSPSSGSEQQQQSQSSTTSSVESSKNYVNYKDQGRFSMDYPSVWHVNSATNRFETTLVDFFNPSVELRLTLGMFQLD